MGHADFWVDNAAQLLHIGGHAFPCDKEIMASAPWKDHALLLSADTDCLSLWDREGLVRTARVGVYPQDMAVLGDTAYVCGGADGLLHQLALPSLRTAAAFSLPGIPERVCLHDETAFVLSLLPEEPVHTALLHLDLQTGKHLEITRFAGIPGALAASADGVWVGLSELALRLPWRTDTPDIAVEGLGIAGRIDVTDDGVIITDSLEGRQIFLRA